MAQVAAPANERKRVKVYELKNNDWFDRGTGFCKGVIVNVRCPLGPHSGKFCGGTIASPSDAVFVWRLTMIAE